MPIALTRSQLGRLAAHSDAPVAGISTAFSVADWVGGTNITESIVADRLHVVHAAAGAAATRYLRWSALGELADVYLQAVLAASDLLIRSGLIARASSEAALPDDMIFGGMPNDHATGGNRAVFIREREAAATVQSDSSGTFTPLAPQRMHLLVRGTEAVFRAPQLPATRSLSGIALVAAGDVSLLSSNDSASSSVTQDWSEIYAMRAEPLTVNGPTLFNWRAVLLDAGDNELASAAAVAGVAEIDFEDEDIHCPEAVKLEIRNTDDGDALVLSATPAETLWQGDIWDATGFVEPDVPDAPTISAPTRESLTVTWPAVADATGYIVERALAEGGPFVEVSDQVGVSYVDEGLELGTEYFYRIIAYNLWGESDPSDVGSGETAVPPNCALELDVYEEDGETIAWTVSTDPAHATPYLAPLRNYGAREIDPVQGSASLSTVQVEIIDKHQTPGDQTTGWMTERVGSTFGRRARLRRWSTALGDFTLIADGPAGTPRMHDSYAGFVFQIRDTREAERRLRPFSNGGTCGIIPRGPIAGFGTKPDASLLLDPVTSVPIVGKTFLFTLGAETNCVVLFNDLWDFTGDPDEFPAALKMDEAGKDALRGVIFGDRVGYPDADILWRLAGSADPWNVARPSLPSIYFSTNLASVQAGVIAGTTEEADGLLALQLFCAVGVPAGMPDANDIQVEIVIRHRGEPSEAMPYYFEGELGALLTALYDRDLENAPDLGGDVHDPLDLDGTLTPFGGGVRYDAAALALLTEAVVLRQTEKVPDGRSWAENALYAPSGWIPSIDEQGRISPTNRERPSVVTGPTITDAIAEPSADWNAGERVITKVGFSYDRFFIPTSPFIDRAADGLAIRPIVQEFRDVDVPEVHQDQPVDYDARAFSAVGDGSGNPLSATPESAALLAQAARYEVLQRYARGAQAVRVRVRRSEIATLREGQWVAVTLSWLPNFATGLRGANMGAAQVLSKEDEECAFATLLLEESVVVAEPGYFSDPTLVEDEPEPGFFTDPTLVSDEEE